MLLNTTRPGRGTGRARLLALGLAGFSIGAQAQVRSDLTFEGAAGIEYDSNITVDELDLETSIGDFSALLEASVDLDIEVGPSDEFSAGYSFNQSLQFEQTDFDLQLHGTNLGYQHDFGPFTVGATHRFFLANLAGDPLLRIHRLTPFVSARPHKRLSLRGEYTYRDKELEDNPDRDADTHSGRLSGFVFVDGIDTFLTGAIQYESEDAVAEQFDFDAVILNAGLRTRAPFGPPDNRLRFDVDFETRDYSAITPSIGEIRDDKRTSLSAEWEVPVGDILYVTAEYRLRILDSNLPSANFTENVASIRIGFEY